MAPVCILIKILPKQENKKGSAKELPVFVLKMADCVRRGGSRRGQGPGFGRRGWLVFRGWWIRWRWVGWRLWFAIFRRLRDRGRVLLVDGGAIWVFVGWGFTPPLWHIKLYHRRCSGRLSGSWRGWCLSGMMCWRWLRGNWMLKGWFKIDILMYVVHRFKF